MKNLSQKQIAKFEKGVQTQLKGYFDECVRINKLVAEPGLEVDQAASLRKARGVFKEKLQGTIKNFLKDEGLDLNAVPQLNQLLSDFQAMVPAGPPVAPKAAVGKRAAITGRPAVSEAQAAEQVASLLAGSAVKLALAKFKLNSDINAAVDHIELLAGNEGNKSKRSMFTGDSVRKKIGKKLMLGVAGVMVAAAVFYGLSFTPVGTYVATYGDSALSGTVSTLSSWGSTALSSAGNAILSPATMKSITTALPHVGTSISGVASSLSATVTPYMNGIGSSLPSAMPLISMVTTNAAPLLSHIPSSMQTGTALVTAAASCFTGFVGAKMIAKTCKKPALLEEHVSQYVSKLKNDAQSIAMVR